MSITHVWQGLSTVLNMKSPIYARILTSPDARDFSRQQQAAMIASGALNKMTSLGMPQSRRSA